MKLKESIGFKIAAIILSYVLILVTLFSVAGTFIMGYYKFYFSNKETVTQEILTDMAQKEAEYICILLDKGTNLETYYKDKNIYFEIINYKTKKVTESNYSAQPFIAEASEDYYIYEEKELVNEQGEVTYKGDWVAGSTINLYVAKDMTKNDIFSVTARIVEIGFNLRFAVVFILLAALICFIVILCYLYCAAGHKKGGIIERNYLDLLPFDIYTAAVGFLAVMSIVLVDSMSYDLSSAVFGVFTIGSIDYFIALGYTLSFATRIKTRTLIKNTLIYRILRALGKYMKKLSEAFKFIFSNLNLVYKTILVLIGFIIIEFLFFLFAVIDRFATPEILILILIGVNFILIGAALYFAIILQKIKQGGQRIAGGDLQYKINTEYMFGEFKTFSESLNNINLGLQAAVNEKMKSERFKTELITNVSHDIKTPLTSIINYVDLIKKEDPQNETVKQYIDVLDRQSGRLKKLVEDLVEASKASTGNLPVNLAVCDVGVLLSQTLGEFEEKLQKAELYPVLKQPEESVKIMADGRHLWRVFDNLMNNVCKYAQSGTRVYLDVAKTQGRAVITFRNISKYQLNVSSEELMERFVRGDSSRNTEGSGLGLSIARSLVDLQNGKMELMVDGDLFKVTISFDIIGE